MIFRGFPDGLAVQGVGGQPVVLVAAQPDKPDDPGGRGEDFGKSSPVGLVLLIVFFIAVAFLIRSMNKHLRKLPASFDTAKPADEAESESDQAESKPAVDAAEPAAEPKPGTTGAKSEA